MKLNVKSKSLSAAAQQDRCLSWLYGHRIGRMLLWPLVQRPVSEFIGHLLDTKLSRLLVPACIRWMQIPMEDYEKQDYKSYNDFFTRHIKKEKRPFPEDEDVLVSPCDGAVTVYHIAPDTHFKIKHTMYTMESLLRDRKLAEEYAGGTIIVLRLQVSDYHRYCYPVSGRKTGNRRIQGVYHTVNPIAFEHYPVFKENTREYTMIESPVYGKILQMEVGALCVGRIVNYHERAVVKRGEEKGRFEFGGSTVILVLKRGAAEVRHEFWKNSAAEVETPVRMGESLLSPPCPMPKNPV